MELMGRSLEDQLSSAPEKKFSIRTVCILALQMINILELIHNKHIIHRDIKPDNFVLGLGEKAENVYLLDFGLAKKYRSSTNYQHYPMKNRKKLTGTARYASVNALKGYEQSRRDDLEAVGYVLMYFLRGSLPWQGLPVKAKEDRYKKIMEKKVATSAEELCAGYPLEFAQYINYTRNLNYESDPDYEYLRNLFKNVLKNLNFNYDYCYDWVEGKRQITKTNTFTFQTNYNILDKLHSSKCLNEELNKPNENIKLQTERNNSKTDRNNIIPKVENFLPKNEVSTLVQKNNYLSNNRTSNSPILNTIQAQRNETQVNYQITINKKENVKEDAVNNNSNCTPIKKSKREKGCCIL